MLRKHVRWFSFNLTDFFPVNFTSPSLFWVASKIYWVKVRARSCLQFLLNNVLAWGSTSVKSIPVLKESASLRTHKGIVGFPLNSNGVNQEPNQNSCAYPRWKNIGSLPLLSRKSSEQQISVFLEIGLKQPLHCKQRLLSVHNSESQNALSMTFLWQRQNTSL